MSVTTEPLTIGDRVKFAEEVQRYTVRAVTRGGRFAICTKPFNPQRTVLYTVVDFDRNVRGTDNYYGLGYESDEQVADALHEFQHTEDGSTVCERDIDGAFCRGGAEVSRRTHNNIPLRIDQIAPAQPTPKETAMSSDESATESDGQRLATEAARFASQNADAWQAAESRAESAEAERDYERDQHEGWVKYARHVEAERDDLRAKVAAVEALADEWERGDLGYPEPVARFRADLRAALATPPTVQREAEVGARDDGWCPTCARKIPEVPR